MTCFVSAVVEKCKEAYTEAIEAAKDLPPTHVPRPGDFSVFH